MELTYTLSEIDHVARRIADMLAGRTHIAFYAPMGAGKTTLIKALCRHLGVVEEVNSPTFAIVNEYRAASGPIYHFDFYRLRSAAEALDIGFYDYIDSPHLCLMEWPECIAGLLPDDTVDIHIEHIDTHTRRIKIALP